MHLGESQVKSHVVKVQERKREKLQHRIQSLPPNKKNHFKNCSFSKFDQ